MKSVISFTTGDPYDQCSRSGVNYAVFERMKKDLNLIGAFNAELKGLERYICALKTLSLDRNRWSAKFNQNDYAFKKRSKICSKIIKKYNNKYDAVYQDGAMFHIENNDKMLVTSHDSNVILSSNGGKYSLGYHYYNNKKLLFDSYQQEKKVYDRAEGIFVRSKWVKDSLVNDFKINQKKIYINPSGTQFDVPDNYCKEYIIRIW